MSVGGESVTAQRDALEMKARARELSRHPAFGRVMAAAEKVFHAVPAAGGASSDRVLVIAAAILEEVVRAEKERDAAVYEARKLERGAMLIQALHALEEVGKLNPSR